MPVRAPHLYPLLRGFVLGSFVVLGRELEEGSDLPFAFEEHVQRGGPALYELRPLVRAYIEQREPMLRAREDARIAVEELRREPAAAIFASAHAGPRATEDEALFRTVMLGLLISTAESCGGFDWDDVGDFKSLSGLLPAGEGGMTVVGDPDRVRAIDSDGLVVSESGRLIAVVGLDDVVIVETDDALLVTSRERAQDVKLVVQALKDEGRTDLV